MISESLILFNLLIKLNNMREKFLNFLRSIGCAQEIQACTGEDTKFDSVLLLSVFSFHKFFINFYRVIVIQQA